ncbi:putative pyridoxamine 5'-phosphate oxidase-related protein [Actinoplanes missouriensis 431]|uniref:Putative pyridoxamine 5'-phosphate oxidase-related protein n=1 Tax=Actinoplanes missouriensis (strain ATCC 14538 / DSM 43046 / CBS 188.64 / JCM 3121 / NBRC 102363 / NCIMB 12654 / NRRL B-3342 / UNCC 431) TaxID=512565 RepID=I0H0Z0_ACTM4|nr:pyridoxamine 5'-phosphate oxidase family protein [Actinoplanes missouriensis]BAL86677.1 putative pyridoxamine 5'-phosphate oxidase-related protein [Actinoplanes missouriensis 431]
MTEQEQRDKVRKMVADARICMVTTMTEDGRHVSRPMALQEVEFDGDLWFFTYSDSDLVEQIGRHPQVNVAFSDPKQQNWISIAGAASQVENRAKAEELWSAPLKAWFPDGLDTPNLTLVKVSADTAEYWEAAHSSKVITLLGYAKAAVTGKTPDAGENETVRL